VPYLRSTSQVPSDEQNWTTQVGGTDPDNFEIRSWPMTLGTRFADSDVDAGTKVIILGATVAEKLFGPNSNPVGQVVRIRNIPSRWWRWRGERVRTPTARTTTTRCSFPGRPPRPSDGLPATRNLEPSREILRMNF
jgi:hypothetical protein